ncbi:hypothetical protein P171DRAFT_488767 [Karstenula rhodostoma CBS 690.94]|uniref:Uncharacterized protein n=1 Tax=Karstenula rhodostoma CBS 690.94 TaxID=1392251 RepID=A0A9P4PC99_9PLEO|nr:hypothetical protein P171DRAFT_488767 [Karstenula rhodostoma CBS 690.94]
MASSVSNGKQPLNPDELYFNDMDIGAWERRAAEQDGLAYGDDYDYGYGYVEDEGYYEDAGNMISPAEYEELLFQRTLDKIRLARATGEADVSLTPKELEVYQNRMWRPRAPAARPQVRPMPHSAPVVHSATTSSSSGAPESSSPRSKKNQRRSSLFGGKDKSKKEKSGNRARATSNATESTVQQAPPGFLLPGPNGQPMFAPINAYQGYNGRDPRQPGSPLRPGSRPVSKGNERYAPGKAKNSGSPKDAIQAQTPPQSPLRLSTTSRDIPGAFPSSPVSYRMPTPPLTARPGSSSSRLSVQEHADRQASSGGRSRSSTVQQPPNLVPFPVTEYKHHNTEPFQYQAAGHLAQPSVQPQYARRVASAETPYTTMPRRVPVPGQQTTGRQDIPSSYSDPAIPHVGVMIDVSEDGAHTVSPTDDSGSSVQTGKSTGKQGSGSGGGKEGERRRRSGRSRRKN